MLFSTFLQEFGGRWTFGTVILIYLISYNESSGCITVFSTIFATLYSHFAAMCKSTLKHIQIPYLRASNKFDFVCLFLAIWMDTLSILTACSVLAKNLSTCLDTMTGGLARILILGRNASANDPWPDVIGVVVVFVVTGMFILGLENARIFSIIMMIGGFGVNTILMVVTWMNGNNKEWNKTLFRSDEVGNFLTGTALMTFSFPTESFNKQRYKRIIDCLILMMVCLSTVFVSLCLSIIIHENSNAEYITAPLFAILEKCNFHSLVPAIACLLVLAISGAFLDLFSQMFNIIVRLATSEWKILVKQISYESPESGNPVIAIFIAGSLCAMLVFACPLQILTHIMAASHLCSGLFRAFYLLYAPFRPKQMQQSHDSPLAYSRLSTVPASQQRSTWSFHLPMQNAMKKSVSNTLKKKKEEEREWLLLGEPSSQRSTQPEQNTESTVFSDLEIPMSDNELAVALGNTDSDTSTDVDAIVDEYRQKIKVTTAGPIGKSVQLPSIASWKITILAVLVIILGIVLIIFGITYEVKSAYVTGFVGTTIISIMMTFIPKYSGNDTNTSPIICTITLTIGTLLLYFCLMLSWPAIILWMIAGLILVLRCDKWCCSPFDQSDSEQIIPGSSSSGKYKSMRIPGFSKTFILSKNMMENSR